MVLLLLGDGYLIPAIKVEERPDGKINVISPLYFVLCPQAVSKYTKPTMNLP